MMKWALHWQDIAVDNRSSCTCWHLKSGYDKGPSGVEPEMDRVYHELPPEDFGKDTTNDKGKR